MIYEFRLQETISSQYFIKIQFEYHRVYQQQLKISFYHLAAGDAFHSRKSDASLDSDQLDSPECIQMLEANKLPTDWTSLEKATSEQMQISSTPTLESFRIEQFLCENIEVGKRN